MDLLRISQKFFNIAHMYKTKTLKCTVPALDLLNWSQFTLGAVEAALQEHGIYHL